jgi:hypothetical protein
VGSGGTLGEAWFCVLPAVYEVARRQKRVAVRLTRYLSSEVSRWILSFCQ